VEASVAPQAVLDELIDIDVESLPIAEPQEPDGDDGAAHGATNGAVDEVRALQEEAAEQEALDPQDLGPEEDEEGAVGVNIMRFRARVVRAAIFGHKHEPEVHYTMGPRRWDGITNRCRTHAGRFPRFADCSSYVTWCIWDALGGPNAGADIVNGQQWTGGYTGTMRDNGRRLPGSVSQQLAAAAPGDLVHYGGGTGKHVTIVVGSNKVVSHGSEGGPYLINPDYRNDIAEVRRYIG